MAYDDLRSDDSRLNFDLSSTGEGDELCICIKEEDKSDFFLTKTHKSTVAELSPDVQ